MFRHRAKDLSANQMMRLGRAWDSHDDHIGLCGQVFQAPLPHRWEIERLLTSAQIPHGHPKSEMAAARDGLADPAHAHNPQPAPGDMQAQKLRWMPPLPRACPHQAFAFASPARGHQDQRHCDISRGIRHRARRVRHGHPMGAGGFYIDVIVSDAEIRQQLAARIWHIGKDIGLKSIPQGWHHHVKIAQCRAQLLCRQGRCRRAKLHIIDGARARHDSLRQRATEQQLHQCILPPFGTA